MKSKLKNVTAYSIWKWYKKKILFSKQNSKTTKSRSKNTLSNPIEAIEVSIYTELYDIEDGQSKRNEKGAVAFKP